MDDTVWQVVRPLLAEQWSPEQIAGRLPGGQAEISHTSIYRWIAQDKQAGGKLYKQLRHGKPYRRRHTKETRGKIPNRRDITERPEIVEKRTRIGDWELDLVMGGKHKGALITLNERVSGLSLQKWVPSKDADKVAIGVIHLLSPLNAFVHTITADIPKHRALTAWSSLPTPSSPHRWRPTYSLPSITRLGNVAAIKTPTACSANTSPRACLWTT